MNPLFRSETVVAGSELQCSPATAPRRFTVARGFSCSKGTPMKRFCLALCLLLFPVASQAAETVERYYCSCGARCPCPARASRESFPRDGSYYSTQVCTCRPQGRVPHVFAAQIVPPAPVVERSPPKTLEKTHVHSDSVASGRHPKEVVVATPQVQVNVNPPVAARRPLSVLKSYSGIRYSSGGCAGGQCSSGSVRGRIIFRRR